VAPESADTNFHLPPWLKIADLPQRVLETYARLWQFETWFRRLVYVELSARDGPRWLAPFQTAEPHKAKDKRLTHMPTAEDDPISYAQLADLLRVVSDNWNLYESFLLPREIWVARMQEISQIRHRVAHFRMGHHDDLQRVVQLVRDVDQGFWRFCTSYNDPHPVLPPSQDLIVQRFLDLDPFPWSQLPDGKWARFGMADPNLPIAVTVQVIRRPWATWTTPALGVPGLLYDVVLVARHQHLNYRRLLPQIASMRQNVVYICLDGSASTIRATIPAVLGETIVVDTIAHLVESARNSLTSAETTTEAVRVAADASAEYIVGPNNPLAFLDPGMPCSFFEA